MDETSKRRRFIAAAGSLAGVGFVTSPASATDEDENGDQQTLPDDVSDNEVKYAKGKLPNFLEGTILDGSKRVIESSDGLPDEVSSDDYEIGITTREADKIYDKAIESYKDKYGVDPSNPRLQIVNGDVVTNEEALRRVREGRATAKDGNIDLEDFYSGQDSVSTSSTSGPTCASDGDIWQYIYPASDSEHSPSTNWRDPTLNAWDRFNTFGVTTKYIIHYGSWDASDVGENAGDLLDDLAEDCVPNTKPQDVIYTGWVDSSNYNGIAGGWATLNACAVNTATKVDWPHDSIIQHEVSHLFDAPDRGASPLDPECIMNEYHAAAGTDKWEENDYDIVESSITAGMN